MRANSRAEITLERTGCIHCFECSVKSRPSVTQRRSSTVSLAKEDSRPVGERVAAFQHDRRTSGVPNGVKSDREDQERYPSFPEARPSM